MAQGDAQGKADVEQNHTDEKQTEEGQDFFI